MNKLFQIGYFLTVLVAQETVWEANGVPIRQGVHIEWQRTVCPGDNGSAIFIWSDTRFGSRNVFAQKVNTNGNFVWGVEGTAVTQLPGRQEDPVAIADGSGGAYIAWVDYRFDDEGDIFIQHVDNYGNRLMVDEGKALAQVDGRQIAINMCTDSSGGVYVTWQDRRNLLDDDIYGTHVSSSQNIVSPGSGVPIIEMNGNQGAKSLEYAGSGQGVLIWTDTRSGAGNDIYGQKFNMDMSKVFVDDGLPIAITDELETKPRTTYMSNDTSFVAWQSGIESSDILFNFLTSTGLVFDQPKVLANFGSNKKAPRVKRNSLGDVFIQWTDYRADTTDGNHYYQKVTNGGVLAWDDSGIALDSDGDEHNARFDSDANGGLHIFWEQGIFPETDIMYRKILSDGSQGQATQIVVSDKVGYQSMPIAVSDGAEGAYVIFADQETSSIDIRTQMIANGQAMFEDNGVLAMKGLDGDVNYVSAFDSGTLDGTVLIWVDNRNRKIQYGFKIDGENEFITQTNGNQLTAFESWVEELENEPLSLFHEGFLYSAVFDASSGAKLIRLNKFDPNLTPLWGDSGIIVYESTYEQRRVRLVALFDGIGVMWSEIRSEFEYDIYFQRFDTNGNPQLQEEGVLLVDGNWVDNYTEAVFPAPDNEIIYFWVEDIWGSGVLKYQRITEDGIISEGWPVGGYVLANNGDPEKLTGVEYDNGVFVAWEELHNFAKDIYANSVLWDGSLSQPTSVAITSEDNDQVNINISQSDYATAMIIWEDFGNGNDFNITGQYVNKSSVELLGDPLAICHEELYQGSPKVEQIRENEYFIIWEDERGVDNSDPVISGGLDVYYSHVIGSEVNRTGVLIQEYHNQSLPAMIWHPTDLHPFGYLIYWIDMRSSGKADLKNLYAQYVSFGDLSISDGILPNEFSVSSAYPNPFNGTVTLDIETINVEPVTLTITNILGQVVYQQTIFPQSAGKFKISWNGKDILQNELSSGIYLYSVMSNDNIISGKFTYLK